MPAGQSQKLTWISCSVGPLSICSRKSDAVSSRTPERVLWRHAELDGCTLEGHVRCRPKPLDFLSEEEVHLSCLTRTTDGVRSPAAIRPYRARRRRPRISAASSAVVYLRLKSSTA